MCSTIQAGKIRKKVICGRQHQPTREVLILRQDWVLGLLGLGLLGYSRSCRILVHFVRPLQTMGGNPGMKSWQEVRVTNEAIQVILAYIRAHITDGYEEAQFKAAIRGNARI